MVTVVDFIVKVLFIIGVHLALYNLTEGIVVSIPREAMVLTFFLIGTEVIRITLWEKLEVKEG